MECAKVSTLQWGHVSRTWKTGSRKYVARACPQASMGPRLKDVEDYSVPRPSTEHSKRFNGATSQGRGRHGRGLPPGPFGERRFNGATSQGRGRPACQPRMSPAWSRLQWGHVSRTWKTTGCPARPAARLGASMGPRLKDVEDSLVLSRRVPRNRCFNGATSQGRGRLSTRRLTCATRRCFNGATSQGRGRLGG